MTGSKKYIALCLFAFTAILMGCMEEPPGPAAEDAASPQKSPSPQETPFGEMIAAWEVGRQEEATQQFVAIDWNAPETLSNVALLNLSEAEFQSLGRSERTQNQEEAMNLIKTLRGTARQAIAAAEAAEGAGDETTAQQHFEAVREFGKALDSPERLELFRMVGRAYANVGRGEAAVAE